MSKQLKIFASRSIPESKGRIQMAPVWIFLLSGRRVIFCSCKKIYFLPGQPGLIFHRKGCIRNNPPQTKGRHHTIRNSIKKGKTFIGSKIIERKQERNNHQKSKMTQNKHRMNETRVSQYPQRKNMKRMKKMQKEKIKYRQDPMFLPVF